MKVLVIENYSEVVAIVSGCFEIRWLGVNVLYSQLGEDVVIRDLGLSDMEGFDVCAQIRTSFGVPTVMLTVLDNAQDIMKGLKLGADDYITKPWKPVEFLAKVRTLFRSTHITHLRKVGMVFQRDNVMIDFCQRKSLRKPSACGFRLCGVSYLSLHG
jgi:two-component system KDP operon response regulator KdpE